jgi:uncharacterized protein YjbI with pentapeptide repeats
MADENQVMLLRRGANEWNAWRAANLDSVNIDSVNLGGANLSRANLSRANLSRANLSRANLSRANLSDAYLREADLREADLSGADLSGANLSEANLREANLSGANLSGANLSEANLSEANLSEANLSAANLIEACLIAANLSLAILFASNLTRANLSGANLQDALLGSTILADVDLSAVIGLQACKHAGRSIIDILTLQLSGPLPLAFLRGVGLPDSLIEYLPSLLNRPIQMYSCFISYSSKDQDFAERLHADIQNKGVRCWFAPHDLPIGAKTWDAIDAAIRTRDKLLLILSENSIGSDWVEDEVNKAFAEERDRKQPVLFPVRIDDSVLQSPEPWARKLRDQRNIGDFRKWKLHDAYQAGLNRLLRDLTVQGP